MADARASGQHPSPLCIRICILAPHCIRTCILAVLGAKRPIVGLFGREAPRKQHRKISQGSCLYTQDWPDAFHETTQKFHFSMNNCDLSPQRWSVKGLNGRATVCNVRRDANVWVQAQARASLYFFTFYASQTMLVVLRPSHRNLFIFAFFCFFCSFFTCKGVMIIIHK